MTPVSRKRTAVTITGLMRETTELPHKKRVTKSGRASSAGLAPCTSPSAAPIQHPPPPNQILEFMISRHAFAAIIFIATAVSGCATPGTLPTKTDISKSRTFDAPFDRVWPAIIGSVAEANLRITTLEKASGVIAIADSSYGPNSADEGTRGSVLGVPDAIINRSASLNIFTTSPTPDKTTVRINISLKMNIRKGNGSRAFPYIYSWEEAYSNGNLEKAILDVIESRIQNH